MTAIRSGWELTAPDINSPQTTTGYGPGKADHVTALCWSQSIGDPGTHLFLRTYIGWIPSRDVVGDWSAKSFIRCKTDQ